MLHQATAPNDAMGPGVSVLTKKSTYITSNIVHIRKMKKLRENAMALIIYRLVFLYPAGS
jgi:hypothetical protein